VIGERVFSRGDVLEVAVPHPEILSFCTPQYDTFPGWRERITEARVYGELPQNLRTLIDYVADTAGLDVTMLSVGPDRDQTIPIGD
jgi:adenylosuccinate synthase